MMVLQPVQPYSPTFFKNLEDGGKCPRTEKCGGNGMHRLQNPRWDLRINLARKLSEERRNSLFGTDNNFGFMVRYKGVGGGQNLDDQLATRRAASRVYMNVRRLILRFLMQTSDLTLND